MIGMKARAFEVAGYVTKDVDINVQISNVVNLYLRGNRREAYVCQIGTPMMQGHFAYFLRRPGQWVTEQAEVLRVAEMAATAGKDKTTTSPGNLATEVRDRLTDTVRPFVVGLTMMPEYTTDIGKDQLDALAKLGWTRKYAASPSTGYARDYIQLDGAPYGVKPLTAMWLPSPAAAWGQSIASTLFELDRTRLTKKLLPKPPEGDMNAKDKLVGSLMSDIERGRFIARLAILYLTQGTLLWLHLHRRLHDACRDLTLALHPDAKEAIDHWDANRAMLLNRPLHPLISYLASCYGTGEVDTLRGMKPLILKGGAVDVPGDVKLPRDFSHLPDLQRAMMAAAFYDFIGNRKDREWGFDTEEIKSNGYLSVGTFAGMMRSIGLVAGELQSTATELGWNGLTGSIGTLNQRCADFVLSNGTAYSEPPGAAILGLRPVMGLNNAIYGSDDRRVETSFNVSATRMGQEQDADTAADISRKSRQEFSVLTVSGHQENTGAEDIVERFLLPASMVQLEVDVAREYIDMAESQDMMIAAAKAHYSSQSPAYVREFYRPPTGQGGVEFYRGSWDGWAITSGNPANATKALRDGYSGQTESAGQMLLYRSRSHFYHRILVQMATGQTFSFFSKQGKYVDELEQDGHLRYEGDNGFSHSTSELENIVNSAHQNIPAQAAKLGGSGELKEIPAT